MRKAIMALFAGTLTMTPVAYAQPAPPPAGGKYVSMGSSFAAGPSIVPAADNPETRCRRSAQNYAHQLAHRHNLMLVDVSCSGSTTAHLLGPWNELAPQLDAVDADTLLVTMTTGGNDLGYLGGLSAMSCRNAAAQSGAAAQTPCGALPPLPTDETYAGMEMRLRQVIAEVHRRAPRARLVIVDYATILPPAGICAVTPLLPAQADSSRDIARRLNVITVRVAKETGTDLIPASKITEGHDVCAKEAWLNGYPSPGVPVEPTFYHPRLAAMTAIADAFGSPDLVAALTQMVATQIRCKFRRYRAYLSAGEAVRRLSFLLLCVVGLCAAGEPPPVDVTVLRSAVAQQRREYINCFRDGNTIAAGDCAAATYNRLADNAKIRDRRALTTFLGVFHETIRPSNEPHRALIYAWFHFIDAVMHEQEAYEAPSHPAGKRPLYDAAALPDAKMVELIAVRRCETQRAYDFSALYVCDLAAARAFVTAIKYRDMYRFDNFALRLQLDADGVNRAGPTAEQMEVRFNLLHDELFEKFGNVFP